MNIYPQGIYNSFRNNELNFSYAHAVLQSLCFLNLKEKLFSFMINNNIRFNTNFSLTNELLNLITSVNNGITADSRNLIYHYVNIYRNIANMIQDDKALSPDSYHFMDYLFKFLHLETNMSNYFDNSYFNQGLNVMRVDNEIYKLFLIFVYKSHNSIISNEIFNSIRYNYICPKCGNYFFYKLENILKMNIDSFRALRDMNNLMRKGTNLNFDELFTYYYNSHLEKCKFCQNNITVNRKLCFPAKTIIISFKRNNHCFYNDVNYPFNYNFIDFISKTRTQGMKLNTNYELKAVISCVKFGNEEKYFADCKTKINNQDIWIRYSDRYFFILQPENIPLFEPQILIYEESYSPNQQQNSGNLGPNINNNSMNNNMNNPNNNINNNIYKNMNMNNSQNNNNNSNMINPNNFKNNAQTVLTNPINIALNNNNNINNNAIENNNDFMLKDLDIQKNMDSLKDFNKSSSPVLESYLSNMQLNPNNLNNQNISNDNTIKVLNQPNENNPFMKQINGFNDLNSSDNKIKIMKKESKEEISVEKAQNQNKNMMKYFAGFNTYE